MFQRGTKRAAVVLDELARAHLAQGELDGEPLAVLLCGICHTGVVLNPTVDGKTLQLAWAGMYNGSAAFKDTETGTYWDRLSGQAMFGPLVGKKMEAAPVQITTVGNLIDSEPDLLVFKIGTSLSSMALKMFCNVS